MIYKIRLHFIFILLLFFMCTGLTAFPSISYSSERVVNYFSTVIKGNFRDGEEFSVSVKTKPNDGTKSCKDWYYIGTDGADPHNILSDVSLKISGKNFSIPNLFICDLADVHIQNGVWLMEDEGAKLLYIEGGDGAGSYTVIFKFLNGSLKSRTLRSMNKFGEIEDKVEIVK